jgi:hypothetical protein
MVVPLIEMIRTKGIEALKITPFWMRLKGLFDPPVDY